MILTFKNGSPLNFTKNIFMPFSLFCILLVASSFQGTAQIQESPYVTFALQDLKDFKPTGGNWKIASDVFYDLNESGKGKISPGTGISWAFPQCTPVA